MLPRSTLFAVSNCKAGCLERRFCGKDSRARSLVLGIGPALLLTLWQNLIMPNMIFRSAMVRARLTCLQPRSSAGGTALQHGGSMRGPQHRGASDVRSLCNQVGVHRSTGLVSCIQFPVCGYQCSSPETCGQYRG